MTAAPQFYNAAKTAPFAESVASVQAGNTVAAVTGWIFNDKGSLLGATTLTGGRLILEVWDGVSWSRGGQGIPLADDAWPEVAITGNVDNTGGAIAAQAVSYTKIGAGRSILLTDIPRGCGREFAVQIPTPLGGAAAAVDWRLRVDDALLAAWSTYAPTRGATGGAWTGGTVVARYQVNQQQQRCDIDIKVTGSTLAATSNWLVLGLPPGVVTAATGDTGAAFPYSDGAGVGTGYIEIQSGINNIWLYRDINKAGSFTAGTVAIAFKTHLPIV